MKKLMAVLILTMCGATTNASAMLLNTTILPVSSAIQQANWASACPPGYHLGPYGQRCWARYACPPGFHAGYYGNSCQINRPPHRPRYMPRSVPRGYYYYR